MAAADPPEPKPDLPPDPPADSFPEQIHRYRILDELGRGSMGRVFLAEDPNIGRRLALKVLAPQHLAQGEQERELQQRFLYEGRAAGCLDHPGIVTVFDADTDPASGLPYLAMEYVEGRSLRQLLDASTPPTPRELLRLLVQVGHALDYAHRHEVVHRDIKPANLLVTQQGQVKVVDFGIAKMVSPAITLPGRTVGTPFYMSPEQVRGYQVDGRSDLFSLGVVLYECVTGRVPFANGDISNIQYAIVHRRHPPARRKVQHLDPTLGRIIDRALAKDPSQRFQRGEAFAGALDALVFDARSTLWIALEPGVQNDEPMEDDEDADVLPVDDLASLEPPPPPSLDDSQGPTEPATPHRPRRPLFGRRPRRRSPRAQRRDRWIAGILFGLILAILYLRHFDLPSLRQDSDPNTAQPPDLSQVQTPHVQTAPGPATDEPSQSPSGDPLDGPPTTTGTIADSGDVAAEPHGNAPVASPGSVPNPPTAAPSTPVTTTEGSEDDLGKATLHVHFRNFLAQAYISLWIGGERQFTDSLESGFWKRNFASGEDFQRRLQVPEGRRSVEVHVSKTQGRKVEARGMVYTLFEAGQARHLHVRLDPGSESLTLSWQDGPP